MTQDEIKQRLKELGWQPLFINQAAVHILGASETLTPPETIENAVTTKYAGENGILFATNQRLLFVHRGLIKTQSHSFMYPSIHGVTSKTGIAKGSMTVRIDGKDELFDAIPNPMLLIMPPYITQRIAGVLPSSSPPRSMDIVEPSMQSPSVQPSPVTTAQPSVSPSPRPQAKVSPGLALLVALLLFGVVFWLNRDDSAQSSSSPSVAGSSLPDHAERVSKASFGTDWPLTVNDGILICLPVGSGGLGSIVFETGGRRYAVNGIAKSRTDYPDIDAIWAAGSANEGPKKNIGPFINKGLSLCK